MTVTKVKSRPIPPDGGWGWVVVFCSFVNQLLCVGMAMSLGIMYVFWLEEFGEDKSLTSWILSLLFFTMCVIGPLPASMAERWGFQVVTCIGGLVMSLGLAVSYFATSIGFLIVTIGCITGSGMAFIYLSTLATVALYFDKRRTLANGIGTSGAGVGCFVMPLLMEKLEEVYGWRGTMLVLAAVTLHICATGLLLRKLEGNEYIYQAGDLTQSPVIYSTGCDNNDVTDEDNVSDTMVLAEAMGRCDKDAQGYDKAVKGSLSGKDGDYQFHERDEDGGKNYDNLVVGKYDHQISHPAYLVVTQIRDTSGGSSRFGSAPLEAATKQDCHFASFDDVRLRNHNKSRMRSCEGHHFNSPSTDTPPKSLQSLDPYVLGSMPSLLKGGYHQVASCEDCISTTSSTSTKQTVARTFTDSIFCQNIQAYMELLRDKKFLLFATSSMLINWAVTIVIVYMADRVVAEGLSTSKGALIVAFNGIGNIIGRVFFGLAADRFFQDHVICYILILTIMGVATLLSALCGQYVELHCLYTTIFGATLGGNVVLMVSVTVTLMGLERTTLALGLNLVAVGIGDLIGPPVGGWLYDVTQTYLYSFLLAGVLTLISALLLLPLRKK